MLQLASVLVFAILASAIALPPKWTQPPAETVISKYLPSSRLSPFDATPPMNLMVRSVAGIPLCVS